MARALVIGGTLFIGRTLVEQLLELGDDVVIMHRGHGTAFGSRVGEIACDRNDIQAVRAALDGTRFDVVYDNVYDWQRGTSAEQVCAAAMATAKGLRRYVFTSSVAVYHSGGEYDEDVELVPSDHPNVYGAQKADTERALFALGREQPVPVTTVRPAFVYGEYNPFDRESFFWNRLLAGRPIVIPGDGLATLQWVYSRDVARAAILASETDAALGRAYNLANYPPITQVDFVRLLARVAGTKADLVHVPRERIENHGGGVLAPPLYFGAYLDVPPITVRADRVRAELGLQLTPLEDGMRETFRWYEQQPRARPDFSWEDELLASTA
ncbi:MAG TPA: NAD-dependent epimerase/dehydratase family protein [Gemmatimonadaceae bacterium]|nr:NAD-dependent epimerase/dehydratase family protein [Gemmatimonadaceae bacterium]